MQHSSVPRRPVAIAVSGNTTVVVCDDGAVFVPRAGIGPHGPLEWAEVTSIPGSAREATLSASRAAEGAAVTPAAGEAGADGGPLAG